jgi:PHD/YefM family antitoxin component YafN of YafNO toxin-antitoxin module
MAGACRASNWRALRDNSGELEIESERETAYLLKSDAMRKRLLEAKERTGGLSLDEVRQKLGI